MSYIADNFGDGTDEAYILNGLGEGGQDAKEFFTRVAQGRWVAVVSRNLEDFKALDFAIDERVKCIAGPDLGTAQGELQKFLIESEAFTIRILTPPGNDGTSQFQLAIADAVGGAINRRQVEINTLLTYADWLTRNSIQNLPNVGSSHGVREYEGALAGLPACVVAAGPSLNAALPHIKAAQDRICIISVGKAYPLLLQSGIVPHVVVNLDLSQHGEKFFRVEHDKRTALLWDGDSHPPIPAAWKGPKINTDCGIAVWEWAQQFCQRSVTWRAMTVAHSCFSFARHLGCDPIMLVGVDLSLPGDQTHADGVPHTWGGKVNELPAGMNFLEIPSVTGGTVKALPNFRSYVTAFEVEIAKTKEKVIQTSPAGAYIRGTECLGIEQAIEKYVWNAYQIKEPWGILGSIHEQAIPWDAAGYGIARWKAIGELKRIMDSCGKAEKWLQKMIQLDPLNKIEEARYARLQERVLKAREDILAQKNAYMLMKRIMSKTATEMKRIEAEIQGAKEERKKISMSKELFKVFFDGARYAAETVFEEMGKL